MLRRTLLKRAGAAAVAETLAIACEGARTAPTASPTAVAGTAAPTATVAGKRTGRISVYSALDESANDALVGAFKAATPGVEVDLLLLAAPAELQTRIRTEKASPKADIFLGGDSSFHDRLGKEGLLESYASANASAAAARSQDPNGHWTGWYFGILGIVLNTDHFENEIGGPRPTSWDDLLDAPYRGKLVLGSPFTTGSGYVFIATQVFRFNRDEARAMEYMKKLHANVARYPGASLQAIQLVSQGRSVAAPSWSHEILTEKGRNPGIDLSVPKGTGYGIGAVSIIKGSKDLPAARAFVDWVLTKEAGELYARLGKTISVRADVAPAPGAPTLQTVELVDYDRDFAAANKDRLLDLWKQTVGL